MWMRGHKYPKSNGHPDRTDVDATVARRITDKAALLLIRRFLQSGVLVGGLVSPTVEGTPQGGPLSPHASALNESFTEEGDQPSGHPISNLLNATAAEPPVRQFLRQVKQGLADWGALVERSEHPEERELLLRSQELLNELSDLLAYWLQRPDERADLVDEGVAIYDELAVLQSQLGSLGEGKEMEISSEPIAVSPEIYQLFQALQADSGSALELCRQIGERYQQALRILEAQSAPQCQALRDLIAAQQQLSQAIVDGESIQSAFEHFVGTFQRVQGEMASAEQDKLLDD